MTPAERLAKYKQNNPRPFEVQDKVYLRHNQSHDGIGRGVTGIVQEVLQPQPADLYSVTFHGATSEESKTVHVSGRDLLLCRPSAKRLFSSSGSLPNISETPNVPDDSEVEMIEGIEPPLKE